MIKVSLLLKLPLLQGSGKHIKVIFSFNIVDFVGGTTIIGVIKNVYIITIV